MGRYIDADKMLKNYQEDICFVVECKLCPFLDGGECLCLVEKFINEQPTADVVEVVRGEWIPHEGYSQCNKCNSLWTVESNYCPNCGAKMERREDDEN